MKFRYLYLQEVTALGEVGSVGAFLFRHELQQSLVPNILENGQIIVSQGYLGGEAWNCNATRTLPTQPSIASDLISSPAQYVDCQLV